MLMEVILMDCSNKSPEIIAIESLKKAPEYYYKAEKLLPSVFAENWYRSSLEMYLKAFWFYKELRVDIAKCMHDIGENICRTYSCKYKFDGEKYYTDCPNILLHHDYGYSMRGTEKYKCSICGLPIIECEHITGDLYDGVVCDVVDGHCNICCKDNNECEHEIGKKYDNVEALKYVYDLNIVTFDMVKDPEMVFTRVTKIYIEKENIYETLKYDDDITNFIYGESELFCHHCLNCRGYDPKKIAGLYNRS